VRLAKAILALNSMKWKEKENGKIERVRRESYIADGKN